MPFRLKISGEEIEAELQSLGFSDVPNETVEKLRKDVLKLIKHDAKKSKKRRQRPDDHLSREETHGGQGMVTSTPLLEHGHHNVIHKKERFTPCLPSQYSEESGYSETESYDQSAASSNNDQQDSVSHHLKPAQKQVTSTNFSVLNSHDREENICLRSRNSVRPDVNKEKASKTTVKGKLLPHYPKKADPVNLYHFYKAHWNKFKVPGEDPRSKLRWDIRSKLLYSE